MDIGAVAKHTGLAPSTLRYYEQLGLIKPNGRKGLRRLYANTVIQQLAMINLARSAGFKLQEIKPLLGDHYSDVDRQMLSTKADQLDRQIKSLSQMRDGLRHAAQCSASSHLACPTFQRLLKIFTKRRPH
ncbi:MAG: helix-turn-helix domain-containing protein [Pseudomonadales bacterium]